MPGGKGIVLYSGGLDSLLTAKILMKQGIDVIGLHCILPFFSPDVDPESFEASKLAKQIGLKLVYYRCGSEFLELVKNPPHGYGKNMNPCIDCKIHFIGKAAELMKEEGADFVATGEVVGQRPMSQHKHMMNRIEKITDLKGRLLRPLCAKILKPTIVEESGIVDREKLYDINGRSRKRQIELVRDFGLDEFSWPAGGCLFTDPFISERVRDLLKYHAVHDAVDYYLLTVGRHFRLGDETKIIVSKNESENGILEKYLEYSDFFMIPEFKGPHILGKGKLDTKVKDITVSIMARYGKPDSESRIIKFFQNGISTDNLTAEAPVADDKLEEMRI